ncbi:hypothetical protein NC652_008188 [Populus alba x Populus x berolinensis]|nr:hypothetical protein NC652_008188 [Populus alba x Populus x berolinensis]
MGFKMDVDVGGGDIRYFGHDLNVGFKASVDNNVCGDARVEIDTDDDCNDEAYDNYIPSNKDGFEFYNKVKDEWIDNLQVDFFTSQTLNGAFDYDNDRKVSIDEDDVDVEVRE